MLELKNFNLFALEGDKQTNDLDVCETLGLDPNLAFTPAINEAAIRKMYDQNVQGYLDQGVSKDKAYKMADDLADIARRRVNHAMKNQ